VCEKECHVWCHLDVTVGSRREVQQLLPTLLLSGCQNQGRRGYLMTVWKLRDLFMPNKTVGPEGTYLLTYSMEQSPSWEVDRFSASQEIPRISRNPTVYHRIHKCPPHALSWASSIQSITPHPTSSRSILILSYYQRLGIPGGIFPSGFPTKTLYTSLTYTIRATWPAHLILPEKSRLLKCFSSKRTNF